MSPLSDPRAASETRDPQAASPGNLDVDTRDASDLLHQLSMAASDMESARLTPSPHCSPGSSLRQRHLDLSGEEAPASQSHAASDDPLDQFRYDSAREPTFPGAWGVEMGIDTPDSDSLVPWTANVRATSGTSQSRWPFARRSPAPSPTIPDLAHQPREIRGDGANDGLNVSPRGASPWGERSQTTACEENRLFAEPWRSRPGTAPAWRPSSARQSQGTWRYSDRPSGSGPEWRTTAKPLGNDFEPRQPPCPRNARMAENTQQSQPTGFQPMMAVVEPERRRNSLAAMQLQSRGTTKFSSRYHGMHSENNASADHLSSSQNCAAWVTNLPGDVEYSELLDAMSNIGRIWCTYINFPDNDIHYTAAAKVVFFKPEAAQRLLTEAYARPIEIRGLKMKAGHNRIKYGENFTGNLTRVLIITGNQEFVNIGNLRSWFAERFVFQVDRAIELLRAGKRAVCEIRFGSYRCQAQMGKMALEKDQPEGFEKVDFGPDPCEVGSDLSSSLSIACARIQGKDP